MAIPDEDPRVAVYAMAGIYLFGGFDGGTRTGQARVSLSEDHEVRDWSERFGVSDERLRIAVGKVGNKVEDVERELRG